MPTAEFQQRAEAVGSAIDTSKTYTLCMWGISPFVDVLNWTACISTRSPIPLPYILGDFPAHLVCYHGFTQ